MKGIATISPRTLRVGDIRALKVSDGFVTFDFFGTDLNVRASAVVAYRLAKAPNPNGDEVTSIEFALDGRELPYYIYDPCVDDWVEFRDAVRSCRTAAKGALT